MLCSGAMLPGTGNQEPCQFSGYRHQVIEYVDVAICAREVVVARCVTGIVPPLYHGLCLLVHFWYTLPRRQRRAE
jgi:hypothetical protein